MKKMKKMMFFALISMLLVVSGCSWLDFNEKNTTNVTGDDYISIEDIESAESLQARISKDYGIDRSNYGEGTFNGKKFKINDIFQNLPEAPDDFYMDKYLLMTGRADIERLCDVQGEVYLQPEFYANNFVDVGLNIYKNPDPNHWTPEGYGTFPHEMETLTAPGTKVTACTFFHSSWGVETYQGFSLHPVYPSSAHVEGVEQSINAEESEKYISVKIVPSSIVIGPAYVKFTEDWAKKVRVNISIAPDTPAGIYAIGFDVGRAPIEDSKRWLELYGEKYQTKGFVSISEPQFIWVIHVTEE